MRLALESGLRTAALAVLCAFTPIVLFGARSSSASDSRCADDEPSESSAGSASRSADPLDGKTDATDLYPPIRVSSAVHAFDINEEVKADIVRKALADLSTKDADCRIVYGPVRTPARLGKMFLLIEAPAKLDAKELIKALKKGDASVELVAWTCFENQDKLLGKLLDAGMGGQSGRDWVLGIGNDLRWVEAGNGFVEFFIAPGKITSDQIAESFHHLVQPFGVKDFGHVMRESFTWPIQAVSEKGAPEKGATDKSVSKSAFDEAAVKRVEKAIAHVAGVKSAHVDASAHTITVGVVLDDLLRSGPVFAPTPAANSTDKPADDAKAAPPPRLRFDTNAVLDALEKEHFTVTSKKEGEDAGPKKGG
jgi:copper chaperone CopZ